MLELGTAAPDFRLPDAWGNEVGLTDFPEAKGTLVAFICNHCPYVIAIADRLSFESKELKKIGVNTIAIMSNDVEKHPEHNIWIPQMIFGELRTSTNYDKTEKKYVLKSRIMGVEKLLLEEAESSWRLQWRRWWRRWWPATRLHDHGGHRRVGCCCSTS